MTKRVLDRYKGILLDMNSTFMFDEDRFDESQDFFATYQRLGGSRLDRHTVNSAIHSCHRGMSVLYEDPARIDDFPSLMEGLRQFAPVEHVDIPLLTNVFAHHERGRVPADCAACLRRLSRTHRLGVVTNIWAEKHAWLAEFETAGIADIWSVKVFSSDCRSMKPSPRLFRHAIDALDLPLSETVFVGDSLRVDVAPAKTMGLETVWINPAREAHPQADYTVASLLELEEL
jgi:putative hydrolase of the HAD superfamily/5'-nucleotidase